MNVKVSVSFAIVITRVFVVKYKCWILKGKGRFPISRVVHETLDVETETRPEVSTAETETFKIFPRRDRDVPYSRRERDETS